ncbi:hypothetical protein B0H10DRAFT_1965627 [Mycena sp. CBHHK59/15]|nr:hypothetical protein B0H10DRAFT_1965627 [Mycena sp. CBHHK59/15]
MTARLSAAANHPDAATRIPRVVCVETNAVNLNYTKPGFVGNSQAASSGPVGELKYWIGQGYFVLKWDGLHSIVIVDEQDCIVAALPGHPLALIGTSPSAKFREETVNCFTYEDLHHRHGNFASINCGDSFGAGQRRPGTLKQSHKAQEEAVKTLSSEPWALRFSAFQSHAFGQNFPKEFAHYKVNLDSGNVASGQCAITVAGNFDHTEGGHLILHEFKLVIEFPSGATALIPSATVTHSNTPLQEGEEHFSFTQYAAGGFPLGGVWPHEGGGL